MSATFYPAKQDLHTFTRNRTRRENIWTFVEVPYEVNLSNSNAVLVLNDLGLNPDFEYANTKEQEIDDFIERCHEVLRGHVPDGALITCGDWYDERYVLHKVAATLGKQNGATHWYFA